MPDDKGAKPVVHTKKHIARLERERRQTRLILISFITILVIAVGLLVYGWLDINYLQLRKPVARVGDVEISTRDFQMRVKIQREGLINSYETYNVYQQYGIDMSSQLEQINTQLNDSETLGKSVLDNLIDEELIRQEAARRGITVSDQELEDRIRASQGYYPDGSPTPTVTPTDITLPTDPPDVLKYVTPTSESTATPEFTGTPESAVTSESTVAPETTAQASASGTAPVEVTGTLELTATATLEPTATATPTFIPTATLSGSPTPEPTSTPYTQELFQKNYTDLLNHYAKYGLTEEQFRELFRTDILREKLYEQVTADMQPSEEQVWARHILLSSEIEAQSVIESLKNGADFGKVASEKSIDTGTAPRGGDLGWFGKGAMVKPFEDAAFSLPVGQVSEPIKTSYGFHVIQVIAREVRPLDAAGFKQARDRAFNDFLATLRDEDKVVTYDEVWKKVVPTEPSFASYATEAALTNPAQ